MCSSVLPIPAKACRQRACGIFSSGSGRSRKPGARAVGWACGLPKASSRIMPAVSGLTASSGGAVRFISPCRARTSRGWPPRRWFAGESNWNEMTESALLTVPPQASCSLRDELKLATRIEHEQLEAALDLMRVDFTLDEYRQLLARYLGFYRSFEAYL